MNEQAPLPRSVAARGELHCIARTAALLLRRQHHLRAQHVGTQLFFADGTSARVYRETLVDGVPEKPCTLIVEFRLRLVHGFGHRLFRWESLLNTPLFVGFPGFVSKLWLSSDQHDVYRGVYEWDGPRRAEHYARSLWRVLEIGCVPGSIHYRVLPGLRRDTVLAAPGLLAALAPEEATAWWRIVAVT